MTLDQFIALNDEISALVRAGVPLERGLAELGGDMPGRLGEIATAVAERSARGEPLDRCILDEAAGMPPAYRAVVQAGLRAGRLPAALEAVAGSARRLSDTYRAAVVAVSYPLLVFSLVWVGAALFTSLLAPQLAAGFRSMDVPGQRFFALLAWLGQGAWYWGPVGPAVVVGLLILWWSACRRAAVLWSENRTPEKGTVPICRNGPEGASHKWGLSPFPAGLPWMGRMLRWSRTATFLEILSLLVENETPLPEAIELAARASGDPQTLRAGQQLAAMLENGARFVVPASAGSQGAEDRVARPAEAGTTNGVGGPAEAGTTNGVGGPAEAGTTNRLDGLPPLLAWLMASAGREGALLPALKHAAATYHRRARHQADLIRTFLPVLLTVVFGGGVTAVYVLALFYPYTAMLRALAAPF